MLTALLTRQYNKKRRERWLALAKELREFSITERRAIDLQDVCEAHRLASTIASVADSYR